MRFMLLKPTRKVIQLVGVSGLWLQNFHCPAISGISGPITLRIEQCTLCAKYCLGGHRIHTATTKDLEVLTELSLFFSPAS